MCVCAFPSVVHARTFTLPSIIRKVLFWGIMITAIIQSVTFTYIISNILVSLSVYISGKHILTTTLRTGISTFYPSIFLKSKSIISHTDINVCACVHNTRKCTHAHCYFNILDTVVCDLYPKLSAIWR